MKLLLLILLVVSNCLWAERHLAQSREQAQQYRVLSYEFDRADGARDQAEHYIHNGCRN